MRGSLCGLSHFVGRALRGRKYMTLIISVILGLLFTAGCKKALMKHAGVFYAGALAVGVFGIIWELNKASFPLFATAYIYPVLIGGGLSGAFFVLVMYAGAVPNDSKARKLLIPVRGQLSIMACILTFAHNIAFGKTYFIMFFTEQRKFMPWTTMTACVCSIIMIAILIPLFVTSFMSVRKKMKPQSWKRLQRLAYAFYALLYIHVLMVTVPSMLAGRSGYTLTVFAYSVVFLGYAFCRITKAVTLKNAAEGKLKLRRRQMASMACTMVLALGLTGALTSFGGQAESAVDQAVSIEEEEAPAAEEPEAVTDETADQEAAEAEEADQAEPEETPAADTASADTGKAETKETAAASSTPAQTSVQTAAKTAAPAASSAPAQAAAPTTVYKDGTYSGSAQGYKSTISVSVTIANDKITSVSITGSGDDEPFFSNAKGVVNSIVSSGSPSVNVVSGATYSSNGIINAVKNAMAKAKN